MVDRVTVHFSPEKNVAKRAYQKARFKLRLGTRLRALRSR
jgi:hypothetical protein